MLHDKPERVTPTVDHTNVPDGTKERLSAALASAIAIGVTAIVVLLVVLVLNGVLI